jgi:hypothetical protein
VSLKTYNFPENCLDFPFIHEDKCGHFHESALGIRITDCTKHFAPGEWVKGRSSAGGKGMIVAVNDSEITILWSIVPSSGVQLPPIKRLNNGLIAQEAFKIQPMTLPSGLIFYLDYTYGAKSEEDKKCNEGPAHARMYWKSRRLIRCFKTRIQALLSSFLSWAHSLPGKRLTSAAKSDVVPDEMRQRLVEKWTRTGLRLPPSGQADRAHDSPPENTPPV